MRRWGERSQKPEARSQREIAAAYRMLVRGSMRWSRGCSGPSRGSRGDRDGRGRVAGVRVEHDAGAVRAAVVAGRSTSRQGIFSSSCRASGFG
jgi:hypothetical protein